jgi:hypothetical protein
MRSKVNFSQEEAREIRDLLSRRVHVEADEQKRIRNQIRSLGFYISDFPCRRDGFTVADFDNLVESGAISISHVHANPPDLMESRPFLLLDGGGKISSRETHSSVSERRLSARQNRDEAYILDLCDEVMGIPSLRQHRFPFLIGDAGTMLPVDGYYPEQNLVIEYREKQHTEAVPFFDKRPTVSGTSRGVQRQLYDERRRQILPEHGIHLIELSVEEFEHFSNMRLRRLRESDLLTLNSRLELWLPAR